jgi:hypothetical protein
LRYETPEAFRRALQDRIRRRVREEGASDSRLRKLVVFERFFARLNALAPGRWAVKGALALDLRFSGIARTTMDADIVVQEDLAGLADLIRRASRLDIGDYFSFDVRLRGPSGREGEEKLIRFHLTSWLAGRVFDEAVLDVAFAATIQAGIEHVELGTLEFAGLEPLRVPLVPIEEQAAEKVHAYTRLYRGLPSTRVKDLADLVVIARSSRISGDRLHAALVEVFERRRTHRMPSELPRPPARWAVAYRRIAGTLGVEPDLEVGFRLAASLLNPALTGHAAGRTWDPSTAAWV